ncbi:hypothetical protein EMEDMD4_1190006 [Sinorhizobium medicae]|uniref:Uncharacterized protein n=1 Tax=Sinorhizobium medicae TaxID=110321 RepID=A0A508WQS4_9HYPH|nr:hypothetical protein EMEDMD4_1190006 [Sinorhizobium medicae]
MRKKGRVLHVTFVLARKILGERSQTSRVDLGSLFIICQRADWRGSVRETPQLIQQLPKIVVARKFCYGYEFQSSRSHLPVSYP